MKKLILTVFSIFSFSAVGAVPELPFPTGSCSGIIPIDDPNIMETNPNYYDGSANLTIVLDFDDAEAFGTLLLFDNWDRGDDEAYAQWAVDQDGSGTPLTIERDELLPASFIGSVKLELPDDDLVPNLVGVQPTGNAFREDEIRFRLLPTAGGATYIIQGLNFPLQGFCSTI